LTDLTVHNVVHATFIEDLFHLTLSKEAFHEFEQLKRIFTVTMQRFMVGFIFGAILTTL
jgi:hypothetical protein